MLLAGAVGSAALGVIRATSPVTATLDPSACSGCWCCTVAVPRMTYQSGQDDVEFGVFDRAFVTLLQVLTVRLFVSDTFPYFSEYVRYSYRF